MSGQMDWSPIIFFVLPIALAFLASYFVQAKVPDEQIPKDIWKAVRGLLFLVLVLGLIVLAASGTFWNAGKHQTDVDNEIPREESRIQYRSNEEPNVTEQGRDIQDEAVESLEEFREKKLEQGDE